MIMVMVVGLAAGCTTERASGPDVGEQFPYGALATAGYGPVSPAEDCLFDMTGSDWGPEIGSSPVPYAVHGGVTTWARTEEYGTEAGLWRLPAMRIDWYTDPGVAVVATAGDVAEFGAPKTGVWVQCTALVAPTYH